MQYGLIGEHLGHSYSCRIHAAIADYPYALCELPPDKLESFFRARDFRGVNVTIPYKQRVIPLLDRISESAARIGAVNTVVNRGGLLYGYNTDFDGMVALLRHAGIPVAAKKALILGTGGTSNTAAAVLEYLGASSVLRVSRSGRNGAIRYEQAMHRHADAQLIVNTTPAGMFPNETQTPVDLSAFPALEGVLDAVYHPLRTNLVLDAQARGIPAAGGLYMLAAQAVYASAFFQDQPPEPALIDRAYRTVQQAEQNLVLIGMPSSGKTTVGRLLAARTGRPFLDTDEQFVSKTGIPIPDYFAAHGEAAFRRVEREVIAEAARARGSIIATGGGAVLCAENVRALARTGVLIFLDRAPERLCPTADRPLAASREALAQLYAQRYPLYRAAADLRTDANAAPEQTADAIIKELSL